MPRSLDWRAIGHQTNCEILRVFLQAGHCCGRRGACCVQAAPARIAFANDLVSMLATPEKPTEPPASPDVRLKPLPGHLIDAESSIKHSPRDRTSGHFRQFARTAEGPPLATVLKQQRPEITRSCRRAAARLGRPRAAPRPVRLRETSARHATFRLPPLDRRARADHAAAQLQAESRCDGSEGRSQERLDRQEASSCSPGCEPSVAAVAADQVRQVTAVQGFSAPELQSHASAVAPQRSYARQQTRVLLGQVPSFTDSDVDLLDKQDSVAQLCARAQLLDRARQPAVLAPVHEQPAQSGHGSESGVRHGAANASAAGGQCQRGATPQADPQHDGAGAGQSAPAKCWNGSGSLCTESAG